MPRYRLLRREELIGVLSGEPAPAGATAVATPAAAPAAVSVDEARSDLKRAGRSNRRAHEPALLQRPGTRRRRSRADRARDSTTLLVAIEGDGTVVGALTLVVFRIPTGVRAWMEDVVVDERARGHGVGEALTREAMRRARERGAAPSTSHRDRSARRRTGVRPHRIPPPGDAGLPVGDLGSAGDLSGPRNPLKVATPEPHKSGM